MKFKALSLLLSSAILLAACNTEDSNSQSQENKDAASEKTEDTSAKKNNNEDVDNEADDDVNEADSNAKTIKLSDVKTSAEDAVKTAKAKAKGELESISFDHDKVENKWVYEVDLKENNKKHEVMIDADKNEVIKTESENDTDKVEKIDLKQFGSIDNLVSVAQKKFDGEVKEWSLDYDDGKPVFNVELKNNKGEVREFEVDAANKEIISEEQD